MTNKPQFILSAAECREKADFFVLDNDADRLIRRNWLAMARWIDKNSLSTYDERWNAFSKIVNTPSWESHDE